MPIGPEGPSMENHSREVGTLTGGFRDSSNNATFYSILTTVPSHPRPIVSVLLTPLIYIELLVRVVSKIRRTQIKYDCYMFFTRDFSL